MKNMSLTIGWLYPKLMNIYGDIGNIISLTKRSKWRGIKTEVKMLNEGFNLNELKNCDLLLMGGAQDKQQETVNQDLNRIKSLLKEKIENDTPGLYVCGGFQFLGKYYVDADGKTINGIGIFDLFTKNPGEKANRLIGNIIFKPKIKELVKPIIGFENHGGRTYLGKGIEPFGEVIVGFGNNGEDKTEGAVYKNCFGTYSHGPILPKNPHLADYLIKSALKIKYRQEIELSAMDDSIEQKARNAIAERFSIVI
jgi:CobQ-like glutamine amidotransferase family enzyme